MTNPVTEFLAATPAQKPSPLIEPLAEWYPEHDPVQAFVHSGWIRLRRQVDSALGRLAVPLAKRLAFRNCGADSWVMVNPNDPNDLKVQGSWCRNRFCQVCAGHRARTIAANLSAAIGTAEPLFITLTLADTASGLRAAIDRLRESFALLRRTRLWADRVTAGAWFLEIKYSAKALRWHPHLHIIALGRYVPQSELSATWKGITGDSYIVDIQRCPNRNEAAAYASKYASKPLNPTFANCPTLLDECIAALTGQRMCGTFGQWRGLKLASEPDEDPDEMSAPIAWQPLEPLASILEKAQLEDPRALQILALLKRKAEAPP